MHPWWELPGVRPGGMSDSAPYALHERRAFLSEKKTVVLPARLVEWCDLSKIKVDRVKMVAGSRRADDVAQVHFARISTGKAGRFA